MRPRGRRGYSLVEMLAAMAVMMVVLGASASLINRLINLDHSARRHRDDLATAGRLARAFRVDAHAAAFAMTPPGAERSAAELRLRGPSGRDVIYEADKGAILRYEHVDGLPRRGESFRLAGAAGHFEVREEGSRRMVVLVIPWPSGRGRSGKGRAFRVEAAIGLDRRFEGGEEARP